MGDGAGHFHQCSDRGVAIVGVPREGERRRWRVREFQPPNAL
jgi:hypothetical protein